jgi:adenylosuccinate lyase
MKLNTLTALSPLDGRYWHKVQDLSPFFSEAALIQYRTQVEIEYFIALCEIPLPQLNSFPKEKFESLRAIYQQFVEQDALEIKEIELVTNHDVKAVEYFLKKKFEPLGLETYSEFIHFGLTSQDINNTAIPLSLKLCLEKLFLPKLTELMGFLEQLAIEWYHVPMLAHTHGQPATPTRIGKELMVFVERLKGQKKSLNNISLTAKFGGAVGNFNAHHIAYPAIDWHLFADQFINGFGLQRNRHTTQIDSYDQLAAMLDNLKRINNILVDLSRDVWQYISMEYFKQKIKANEVGSSAMPHKVNPIDFENAEGNLLYANAILEFLSAKLPVSRLQRDLTDSTVLRNLGMPIAHGYLAFQSLMTALSKISLNTDAIDRDLENHWEVVAEAIQTILRREQYPQPYEALKALTRQSDKITKEIIYDFIDQLSISDVLKAELKQISPFNYVGI